MSFIPLFSCCAIVLSMASCQPPTEKKAYPHPRPYKTIHVDIEHVDPIKYSSLYETIELVKLEGDSTSLLGEIGGIKTHKEKLFFFTPDKITIFSNAGAFLQQINRTGSEKGHYLVISDIFIDPDTDHIFVYDSKGKKIIEYNVHGDFVDEKIVGLDGYSFTKVDSNTFPVYIGAAYYNEQTHHKLNFFSASEETLDKRFVEIRENETKFMHFGDLINFPQYRDTISFLYPTNDTIYHVTQNGIYPRIYIDFGKQKLPKEVLNENYSDVRDFVENCQDLGYAYRIIGFFETDDCITFACPYKQEFLHVYHSKVTGNTIVSNTIENDFLLPNIKKPSSYQNMPKAADGKNFYTLIDSYAFIAGVDSLRASLTSVQWKKYEKNHPNVVAIYQNTKIDDNPIVMIGKTKMF